MSKKHYFIILSHHYMNLQIQYTLFLKDIGLNFNDAIQFWKVEYSKPACSRSDFKKHSSKWKDSSKRYEYGIRHLYGLEGSCRNYRSHCCSALQTLPPNAAEEGGCPFVYFDYDYLRNYLQSVGVSVSCYLFVITCFF